MNHKNYFEIHDHKLYRYISDTGEANITIPYGVISIEAEAFRNHKSLKKIFIPDTVITIENNAFEKCGSLRELIIPASIKKIGNKAFQHCNNLKTLIFLDIPHYNFWYGEGKHKICVEDFAFFYCDHLKELHFSKTAEIMIRKAAFCDCIELRELILPAGVTEIGEDAFRSCGLETVTFSGAMPQYYDPTGFKGCTQLQKVIFSNLDFPVQNQDKWRLYRSLNQIVFCADAAQKAFADPESDSAKAFFHSELKKYFHMLMNAGHTAVISEILQNQIIPQEIIEQVIRYAIEQKNYEVQVLLMNYQYQHNLFQDIKKKFE